MAWQSWTKALRTSLKWISIGFVALFSLFLVHQWFLPLIAIIFPSLDPTLFDFGVYGAYPTQHFISFDLEGPQAKQLRWDEKCDQGLVLLTPNGPSIEQPGPMILDASGDLVWMSDDFGVTANLKVQEYKGEDYLTLWSGEKAATSGKGVYFMIDSSYQVVRMISAIGEGLFGDLHEFKITQEGTALLTVYNTTQADLTGMGMGRGPGGWIVDNLFQEIDLETGELLFQWRASDHFNPIDTYMTNPLGGYWESIPFDYYHLNSVDKDSRGNYIISSRHFHSITCISPGGEILWVLGGRDNQFKDLSDGLATNFKWQHDVRWVSEEEGILTVFDNSKAGPLHVDAHESRVLFVQLDIESRTARLVQSLTALQGILASSQGSVQVLPDTKQTFVGWGSAAAYSEYSNDGELLCETHLGASWSFWFERFKSYRTTKALNWRGNPHEPPVAKILDDALFVSWNGATEVAFWSLEMCQDEDIQDSATAEETSDNDADIFESIDIIPKTGFEGSFALPSVPNDERSHTRYRVAALNSQHEVLRYSEVIHHVDGEVTSSSILVILFKLSLVLGFCIGVRSVLKYYRATRRADAYQYAMLSPPAWTEWKSPSPFCRVNRSRMYDWVLMRWSHAVDRLR